MVIILNNNIKFVKPGVPAGTRLVSLNHFCADVCVCVSASKGMNNQ